MDKTSFLAPLMESRWRKKSSQEITKCLMVKIDPFYQKFQVKILGFPTDICNSNRSTKVVLKTFFGPKAQIQGERMIFYPRLRKDVIKLSKNLMPIDRHLPREKKRFFVRPGRSGSDWCQSLHNYTTMHQKNLKISRADEYKIRAHSHGSRLCPLTRQKNEEKTRIFTFFCFKNAFPGFIKGQDFLLFFKKLPKKSS